MSWVVIIKFKFEPLLEKRKTWNLKPEVSKMQSTPISTTVFLQLLPYPLRIHPTRFSPIHTSLYALLLMEEIWLTTWDLKNLMKNGIFTISAGAGFLPSTVSRVTLIAMKIWWSKHYNYSICSHSPLFSVGCPSFFSLYFYGFHSPNYPMVFASFKTFICPSPISKSHSVHDSSSHQCTHSQHASRLLACFFFGPGVQLLQQEKAPKNYSSS